MKIESIRDDSKPLTAFYRGKVVHHCNHGKCKVFIHDIHDPSWETDWENLPDAEQASPIFAGNANGNGMFSYPNIGSTVWVFFQNGDQQLPVYFATTLGGEKAAGQFAICNAFPDDDSGAYRHKICCGASTITMSEMGNVIIENRCWDPEQEKMLTTSILMDQSGHIQINGSNSVRIQTNQVDLRAVDTLQVYTKQMKIKATERFSISSPYISLNTKEDVDLEGNVNPISDEGVNGVNVVSDTINLNAEKGYINTNSSIVGPKVL